MRAGRAVFLGILLACPLLGADEPATRYTIAPDLKTYPQATPKEALASVLAAVGAKKFAYLTAQLADPEFIDQRVKKVYGGQFEEQVEDTRARLDPATVKLLKRFLTDGTFVVEKNSAAFSLKDTPDRVVYFRRLGDRWFLQHGSAPERSK
jgi:hypothetical protein